MLYNDIDCRNSIGIGTGGQNIEKMLAQILLPHAEKSIRLVESVQASL